MVAIGLLSLLHPQLPRTEVGPLGMQASDNNVSFRETMRKFRKSADEICGMFRARLHRKSSSRVSANLVRHRSHHTNSETSSNFCPSTFSLSYPSHLSKIV